MAGNMKVGIGGLGAIGLTLARAITDGRLPGLELGAVSARNVEKAQNNLASIGASAPVVSLEALAETCDVVVECAPASVFQIVAEAAISKGRIFVPVSIGALLNHMELVEKANETGARMILPTGALIGLDAVRAAAEGIIESVTLETRKPPLGLGGAPYLVENDISVEGLTEAKKVFEGNARAAAKGFPANVNVAAALSLAGIGPDRTSVEIWADPSVTRNTHTIRVEADSARFTMTIENIPTEENPKTGKITALSVIATLRRLNAPLTAGT
ncbi:aspartate dehydrogenase [Nisaea nitritireducens]|uniref:aspartate dehydrogenase n=1 Tax=Nisaea nitritireducens TaxID=568392 RepID=UPI001D02B5F1|nr:aspartate dehydrogenase [Nisaea nitritireducens]